MPVLPVFSGGSTFVLLLPVSPNVWMTPTEGFPGSPTIAIVIVTTPLGPTTRATAAPGWVDLPRAAAKRANVAINKPDQMNRLRAPGFLTAAASMSRSPMLGASATRNVEGTDGIE